MNQVATTTARTGRITLPMHLRGKSFLYHGASVQILEGVSSGDPKKVWVRHGSREYEVDRKYVNESS